MAIYEDLINYTDAEWKEVFKEFEVDNLEMEDLKRQLIKQAKEKELKETRGVYYHFTDKDIAEEIEFDGILMNGGNGIYVCKDIKDILKFIKYRVPKVKLDSNGDIIEVIERKLEDLIIIKFLANDSDFEESFDHVPEAFEGAKAWVSWNEEVEIEILEFHEVKN